MPNSFQGTRLILVWILTTTERGPHNRGVVHHRATLEVWLAISQTGPPTEKQVLLGRYQGALRLSYEEPR